MRVDLNAGSINQNADREVSTNTTSYGASTKAGESGKTQRAGGFTLDISGTVTDNAAYGMGELKSAAEIMQDAGQMDTALQRDFMAVMSNSMSAEDFAKLSKDGFSLSDMNIEEHVTSLDKLKCKLAEAGVIIEGYNDDMSEDELNAITGSTSLTVQIKEALKANDLPVNEENTQDMVDALNKAENLTPLKDESIRYMVVNDMDPTIDDLYRSEFTANNVSARQARGYYQDGVSGYYAKKADVIDWDQIKGQAEKILKDAGFSATEGEMSDAKWLVEEGIPLTKDTIKTLRDVKSVKIPMDRTELLKHMAISIADGDKAEKASLIKDKTFAQEAVEIKKAVEGLNEGHIQKTLEAGKPVNIRNLTDFSGKTGREAAYDRALRSPEGSQPAENSENEGAFGIKQSDEYISSVRFLEETRLIMTAEANYRLLKTGISIDTLPLEQLVDRLREAERDFYRPLLDPDRSDLSKPLTESLRNEGSNADRILDERILLFKQSISVYDSLRTIPSETLAGTDTGRGFTARAVNEAGSALREEYIKAGRSYEALMTAPRSDLGDSIKKAFRNVDDILLDNFFELDDANRKAVRILGYAGMEINEASINRVKQADLALEGVIERMTPAKTLEMIRNGENPLDENIFGLYEKLNREEPSDSTEKYSKFLVRLEKNKEITEDEKSAFIGIYRLFRQIEKSDYKLLGNVMNADQGLTLRNIIGASRSNRAKSMDISVDDHFGGLSELIQKGESITGQIDRAFSSVNTGSLNTINDGDPTELMEKFRDYPAEDAEEDYKESLEQLKTARAVDDQVIELLRENEIPVTIDNLLSSEKIMNERGKTFKDLFKNLKDDDISGRLLKNTEKINESLTDKISAAEAYEEFKEAADELINERALEQDKVIDVKELSLLHKQISLAASYARNENYEVPVNIDGEWTSINLRILRNKEEKGIVSVTMETQGYGRIGAKFSLTDQSISGYVTGDKEEGLNRLRLRGNELKELIEADGRELRELDFIDSDKTLDLNAFAKENDRDEAAETKDLYEIGKAFVTFISKQDQ
ncbi:MAG: DUF6240 domain-containing protein [Lachnospiraceae bacterium]|nr:DUF6240 domain-containing protein [Lachnospiraceae bacterium]